MIYALNLTDDGRILSACIVLGWQEGHDIPETYNGMPVVEKLPDGDVTEYRYIDGEFVYDPKPTTFPVYKPTQLDIIEAQVTYTAMMTGTLLEE